MFISAHALIIGAGKYQYVPIANVRQAINDATALAQVLSNPDLGGYPENQVTVLTGEAATKDAVIKSLQQLANEVTKEDFALIFYSGHGDFAIDGAYYLTTTDTQLDSGKIKIGTGISQSDLLSLLRAVKAERLLLVINTNGASLPDLIAAAALATGQSRIIIAACQEDELSWVGNGPLSIFGQALVDGLNGAAKLPNSGGYISVNDLYNYVYETVTKEAVNIGKTQQPVLTTLKQMGRPLLVAQYPKVSSNPDNSNTVEQAIPAPAPVGEVRRVGVAESQVAIQIIFQEAIAAGSVININTGSGRQIGTVQGSYNENSGSGTQNNVSGTQNNVTGTQNNVQGNQFNSDRDQFIGNRNVSTGSGGINDYGGVQGEVHNYGGVRGSVNSGSGSQSNYRTGEESLHPASGDAPALGSVINSQTASLLAWLRSFKRELETTLSVDTSNRNFLTSNLSQAIALLRDHPTDTDTTHLQCVMDGLSDADLYDRQDDLKKLIEAAGLVVH